MNEVDIKNPILKLLADAKIKYDVTNKSTNIIRFLKFYTDIWYRSNRINHKLLRYMSKIHNDCSLSLKESLNSSFSNVFSDLITFIKVPEFESIINEDKVHKMIWSLTSYWSKFISYFSNDLNLSSEFWDNVSILLIVLMITRSEELRMLNDEPENYNLLSLDGDTYYETTKSVASSLLQELEKIEWFPNYCNLIQECIRFIINLSENAENILLQNKQDEVLLRYKPTELLDAWIYAIWLSKQDFDVGKAPELFLHLQKCFDQWEPTVKYRIMKLLFDKINWFINYENIVGSLINICSNIIFNDVRYLKDICIDLLTKIITKFDIFNWITNPRNSLIKIISKLVTSIDLPGVDEMINLALLNHIIGKDEIEGFLSLILFHLKYQVVEMTPDDYMSQKAIRYWDVLKTVISSESYNSWITDIFEYIFNNIANIDNLRVKEQIISLCTLGMHKTQEVEKYAEIWVSFVDSLYEEYKDITDEIAEIVNHLSRYGKTYLVKNVEYTREIIAEHTRNGNMIQVQEHYLDKFIRIGLTEVQRQNANSEVHKIQGNIFLQSIFINLLDEDVLDVYIPIIVQKFKEGFIDCSTLMTLIFYNPDETMKSLNDSQYIVEALSSLITYMGNIKYKFPIKIWVLAIIHFVETQPQIEVFPIFHFEALKRLIFLLDDRLNSKYKKNLEREK